MIHERLMRVGSWSLKLRPNTPTEVRALIAEMGHVFVLPVPLDVGAQSDANVQANALWSGVVIRPPVDGEMSGWGLGWWLGGDGTHQGDAIETTPTTFSAVTLSSALSTLLPTTQPVAAGSVDNTGLSTVSGSYSLQSRWAVIRQLCDVAGAEFAIRPDFTLDAAADTVLFPTLSTPTVLLTGESSPADLNGTLRGFQLSTAEPSEDWAQYATKVVAVAKMGDAAPVATGSATRTTTYLDGRGNTATLTRFINAPTTPDTDADTVAQLVLNLSTGRQSIRLAAMGDVRRHLSPGDGVYVYEPTAGLYDTANQVEWRETIFPAILRCVGMDWPVQRGGVYYRSGAGVITDLTNVIEWETGKTTTIIVGAGDGGPLDDVGASPFSPVEQEILNRAALPAKGSWTPVVDGTTTDPTLSAAAGHYRIEGGTLFAGFKCTFSVNGSGTYTITGLPVVPPAGRASFVSGDARLQDASTGNVQRAQLVVNDSGVITIRYVATAAPGAEVQPTNALPWTWAAGDTIEGWVSYPVL